MTMRPDVQTSVPSRPQRAARVAERLVDGELVLYDPLHQRVHVLNPTAALTWRLCDGQHTAVELVEALAERYPASRAAIEADVPRIVNLFRAEELLDA